MPEKITHKNIDEFVKKAVDLKELDLYDCETFFQKFDEKIW